MYYLYNVFPDLLIVLIAGCIIILLFNLVGKYFLSAIIEDNMPFIANIISGYMVVSAIFNSIFFGFKSILSALLVLIIVLLIFKKDNLKFRIRHDSESYIVPVVLFILFLSFRVIAIYSLETGFIRFYMKDDLFYINTLSAMFYTRNENIIYEHVKQILGFPYRYFAYHYITFSGGLLLKYLSGINAYLVFHLFMIPFFQMFASLGLYSILRKFGKNALLSLLISVSLVATLRYNLWDDFIVEHFTFFNKSFWFKNFLGHQLLGSGFSIKLCVTTGVISLLFLLIPYPRIALHSMIFIFINPLLVVSAFISQLGLILFRKVSLMVVFFVSAAYLVGYFVSVKLLNGMSIPFDKNVLFNVLNGMYETNFKLWIFSTINDFLTNYLNLLIFPVFILLFISKLWQVRATSVLMLFYPFSTDLIYRFPVFKIYPYLLIFSFLSLLWYYRRNNYIVILFIWIGFSFIFAKLGYILPEFEQSFWLIMYTSPLVLASYVYSRLRVRNFILYSASLFLFILNFYQNYLENEYKCFSINNNIEYFKNISENISDRNGLIIYGVLNSNLTMRNYGRLMAGEELFIINDRYIPTTLYVDSNLDNNFHPPEYVKTIFPFSYLESTGIERPDSTLVNKYKINPVIVNYNALHRTRWISNRAIDSVDNILLKQKIYFLR